MKRRFFHIVFCIWVCIGLSSCVYDGGPYVDGIDGDRQALYVSFRLTTQSQSTQKTVSRGATPPVADETWGDDYVSSDAIAFEEKILKDMFYVAFYEAGDNKYIGRLGDILCTGFEQSGSGDIYEFRGVLQLLNAETTVEELQGKKVKMMVVANVPGVSDETLKNGLGLLTYGCVGLEDEFQAIPMWGVCSTDLSGITPGEAFNAGSVSLLRAMAKIEVCVADKPELEDVTLESITVNRLNTIGYALPGGWGGLEKTTDLKFAETLRIPDNAGSVADFARDSKEKSVVLYVPECENNADNEIIMTVAYKLGGERREGTVRVCPYADGKPSGSILWNIVRNHHYQYEISSVSSDNLQFNVTIADMEIGGIFDIEI